jgi:hypothetical protein
MATKKKVTKKRAVKKAAKAVENTEMEATLQSCGTGCCAIVKVTRLDLGKVTAAQLVDGLLRISKELIRDVGPDVEVHALAKAELSRAEPATSAVN